ncbi:M23 family metallopeptidase [Streptomyces marianii]|uniref:M23 family metallopeptidase n=1 Tax=Streptomyces marianii TaxID=1817406 RepID=A0A5R9E6V4_9ACTN|nr:M23 family metallopeptidase [Streptomyces marianii]TLQ45017.1 M23 family metallopeptidase [Streptomyces marianii]
MSVRKTATVGVRVLWAAFFALAVLTRLLDLRYPDWLRFLPAAAAIALSVALGRAARRRIDARGAAPVETASPVAGRWTALNSPADKVPSHGTHEAAQSFAIDIVAECEEHPRPRFASLWPLTRRNREFPAFNAPLYAVADATVVRATDRQRDHMSRNSLPALLWLLAEGVVRMLGGTDRIFGNHLVLDLGDGTWAVYAHLRRGSLAVREGEQVTAGQLLARCGNSGNSTEPHLHFQLMDGPDLEAAHGVPFTWRGVGVPRNKETFTAQPAAPQNASASSTS